MDSSTHVDTPGCVCSTHTDVFTFIPRHTHTHTHSRHTHTRTHTHSLKTHTPQVHSAQYGVHAHTLYNILPLLVCSMWQQPNPQSWKLLDREKGINRAIPTRQKGWPRAGGSKAADKVGISRHPESLGFCQKSRGVRSPKSQSKRSLMPSPSSRPK